MRWVNDLPGGAVRCNRQMRVQFYICIEFLMCLTRGNWTRTVPNTAYFVLRYILDNNGLCSVVMCCALCQARPSHPVFRRCFTLSMQVNRGEGTLRSIHKIYIYSRQINVYKLLDGLWAMDCIYIPYANVYTFEARHCYVLGLFKYKIVCASALTTRNSTTHTMSVCTLRHPLLSSSFYSQAHTHTHCHSALAVAWCFYWVVSFCSVLGEF